ncbi:MAG TPA: MFS transporter [Actinocrinis sp.]|jgi:EmrB/QacA subfamily drug resistance transporter
MPSQRTETEAGPQADTTIRTDSAGPPALKLTGRQWLVLTTVIGADVMDLLDSTIVNVGAPSIARDLHATSTQLQWTIAGYTLAMAVLLITGGRLGDLYGRRRMFILGVAGFTVFSALCSLAPDPQFLITSRVLQGLSAALMLPQGLSLLRSAFRSDQAGAVMGLFGPAMGVAATLGPIVGGALVQADLFGSQWRSIFWINIPVGLLAVLGALRAVPKDAALDDSRGGAPAPTLDVLGMILSGAGMLLLIYPLIQGREHGWPASMFALMAASVPAFALFGLQQRARQRAGRTTLVTLSLFRKPAFVGGQVFGVIFFCGMSGLFLVVTLHLQTALHYSPMHAGLTGLPFSLGTAVGAALGGGALAPRYGRKVLLAGVVVGSVSLGGTAWTVAHFGDRLTSLDLAGFYGVCGVGMGMLIATFFSIVVSAIEDHETGSAGGVINALQQLGSSLGAALFGTLYFDGLAAGHGSVAAASGAIWWSAGILAVCFPLAFLLPRRIKPSTAEAH